MIATLGGINWLSQEGKFGLLIVVKKSGYYIRVSEVFTVVTIKF